MIRPRRPAVNNPTGEVDAFAAFGVCVDVLDVPEPAENLQRWWDRFATLMNDDGTIGMSGVGSFMRWAVAEKGTGSKPLSSGGVRLRLKD